MENRESSCACGHPEGSHWPPPASGTVAPPYCVGAGPRADANRCPCFAYRPRRPAPLLLRLANRVLGRLGQ